jgi:hypothetical protein
MELKTLNQEYNRFTKGLLDLKELSTQLNDSEIDPIKASEIESNLAKLGVILLHASLEQYFKWLLAKKLGFESIGEAQEFLGQLKFLKPNTLPIFENKAKTQTRLDTQEKQFTIISILKIYSVDLTVEKQHRGSLDRQAFKFNQIETNLPRKLQEAAENYKSFVFLRNKIAHESDLSDDINFATLDKFNISCKIMLVYYFAFLLFKCEFPEDFSTW